MRCTTITTSVCSGRQQEPTEHALLVHSWLVGGACCHGGGRGGIVRAGAEGAPWLKLEVGMEGGIHLREMTEHGQHVDKHEDDSERRNENYNHCCH